MRVAFVALMLAGTSLSADTEIYRCPLDDGTFAFQEKPCPEPPPAADVHSHEEPEAPAATGDALDFVNPFDEPEEQPRSDEVALPEPISRDRDECEKTTRDAIDAIDLEMRQSAYSKEQGQAYLAELRVLTQQLRACKQL